MAQRDDHGRGFIGLVADLAAAGGGRGLTIAEVRDRLDERGFGLLVLILAIPCLVPALYGVPQLVGIPILLLAGQIVVGRHEPWLPKAILRRRVSQAWLDRMADFATKRMGWFEQLSRPRLKWFACGVGERLAGLVMLVATLTIILPLTNTVPSIALTLMAVGLIERDGAFVALGEAVALGWAGFLAALVIGLALGAGWALQLFDRFGGQALLELFR